MTDSLFYVALFAIHQYALLAVSARHHKEMLLEMHRHNVGLQERLECLERKKQGPYR